MKIRAQQRVRAPFGARVLSWGTALGLLLGAIPAESGGSPRDVPNDAGLSGGVPPASVCFFFATGGSVSVITEAGTTYCVHQFTTVGTSTFEVKRSNGLNLDVIVVGGGGGGGRAGAGGGGGGAGGLIEENGVMVGAGSRSVTVGAGGAGAGAFGLGQNGGHSQFLPSLIALGGGGGGGNNDVDGQPGGSGGGGAGVGAGAVPTSGGAGQQPTTVSGGFGNDGGIGKQGGGGIGSRAGGGGGGAQSPGGDATGGVNTGEGGVGGDGRCIWAGCFGGGGGGTAQEQSTSANRGGAGGLGGGGDGEFPIVGGTASDAQNGAPNTGGGGGGARNNRAGNGGSGIVILRYELETFIERTGGSASITVAAAGTAGAAPAATVDSNGARLVWVSLGANKIEVRRDSFGPVIPPGLKLFVKLGNGAPVEIPSNGSYATLLANTTDAGGDEALTYSVTFDPASALRATAPVSVELEFRIGPP